MLYFESPQENKMHDELRETGAFSLYVTSPSAMIFSLKKHTESGGVFLNPHLQNIFASVTFCMDLEYS